MKNGIKIKEKVTMVESNRFYVIWNKNVWIYAYFNEFIKDKKLQWKLWVKQI